MGMRTVQYHPIHARKGMEFDTDCLPPEANGWVDTPAKFPDKVPKRVKEQTLEESLERPDADGLPALPARSAEPDLASPADFPDGSAYLAEFRSRLDLTMPSDAIERQMQRAVETYGAYMAAKNVEAEQAKRRRKAGGFGGRGALDE